MIIFMEDIVNLIASDESASDISDAIKGALFAKASEKIENIRPEIAKIMFGDNETEEIEDQE